MKVLLHGQEVGRLKAVARRAGIPYKDYKKIAATHRSCTGRKGKSEKHWAPREKFRLLLSGVSRICEDCRKL